MALLRFMFSLTLILVLTHSGRAMAHSEPTGTEPPEHNCYKISDEIQKIYTNQSDSAVRDKLDTYFANGPTGDNDKDEKKCLEIAEDLGLNLEAGFCPGPNCAGEDDHLPKTNLDKEYVDGFNDKVVRPPRIQTQSSGKGVGLFKSPYWSGFFGGLIGGFAGGFLGNGGMGLFGGGMGGGFGSGGGWGSSPPTMPYPGGPRPGGYIGGVPWWYSNPNGSGGASGWNGGWNGGWWGNGNSGYPSGNVGYGNNGWGNGVGYNFGAGGNSGWWNGGGTGGSWGNGSGYGNYGNGSGYGYGSGWGYSPPTMPWPNGSATPMSN